MVVMKMKWKWSDFEECKDNEQEVLDDKDTYSTDEDVVNASGDECEDDIPVDIDANMPQL